MGKKGFVGFPIFGILAFLVASSGALAGAVTDNVGGLSVHLLLDESAPPPGEGVPVSDAPREDDVEKANEDGEHAGEEAGQTAEDAAPTPPRDDEAQRQAEGTIETLETTAEEEIDSATSTLAQTRDEADSSASEATSLAWAALHGMEELLGGAVECLQACANGPSFGSSSHSSSGKHATTTPDGAAPVVDPETAGIAMVVAAASAGGLLLWWVVLQRVVLLGAVPLLSRIARSEIYSNDARRLIAELVVANPGFCLNEVVERTGYSRNAVSYHLFVLEKEEALISIKDGKYRRYFPRGGKYVNGAKNVVSALRNETTLAMARFIVHHPGAIQRELCAHLGTTASAACWHAKRLEDLHVIRKERVANTVRYFPGDALTKYDLSEFWQTEPAVAAPTAPASPSVFPAPAA